MSENTVPIGYHANVSPPKHGYAAYAIMALVGGFAGSGKSVGGGP